MTCYYVEIQYTEGNKKGILCGSVDAISESDAKVKGRFLLDQNKQVVNIKVENMFNATKFLLLEDDSRHLFS